LWSWKEACQIGGSRDLEFRSPLVKFMDRIVGSRVRKASFEFVLNQFCFAIMITF